MAFKYELSDGSKWSPEAGGYVKDGKLVSNIPQFTEGATTKCELTKSILSIPVGCIPPWVLL